MKDFVLFFRELTTGYGNLSESDMQAIFRKWDDWFEGIAAQGKLTNLGKVSSCNRGIRLDAIGKVVRLDEVVTDGPFVEIKELLNGFIVITADSLDEAVLLARGCPILDIGGSVEIRPFFA